MDPISSPAAQPWLVQDVFERRLDSRVAADEPVEIHSSELATPLKSRTHDISVSGVCVATTTPFALEPLRQVVLHLPSESLTLGANGRWQRKEQEALVLTGIAFQSLDQKALNTLLTFVFHRGKELGSFLYENSEFLELGLADTIALAQSYTRYRDVSAGCFIYRQNTGASKGGSIFVVLWGTVALKICGESAAPDVTLGQLEMGDVLGGLPAIAHMNHLESAVAETDVRLLEIDRNAYQYVIRSQPRLAHQIARIVFRVTATRLRNAALNLSHER